MLSVAAALNVLSLNGITHGGIKASNVIVKSSGEAILTDTGLHKLMKADSDMKENPESFAFAAPEEFKEGKGESGKGGKGDSWSFGTLLHQVPLSFLLVKCASHYSDDSWAALLLLLN